MSHDELGDRAFIPMKSRNAVTLLHARELGHDNGSTMRLLGKRRLSLNDLASTIAWNPRRMNNIILAVGPGTPATANSYDQEEDPWSSEDEDMHPLLRNVATDEDSQDEGAHPARVSHETSMQLDSSSSSSDNEQASQDMEASIEEESQQEVPPARSDHTEPAAGAGSTADQDSQVEEDDVPVERTSRRRRPRATSNTNYSIRHGGCINTACWLDGPWRLSTVNEAAGILRSSVISMDVPECTTQLMTSGDDRLVKVWDLYGAMGMDNPLAGGWNTLAPFCTTDIPDPEVFRKKWNRYYAARHDLNLSVSGSVLQVGALSTAHRGNVFHVTPVHAQPGKVLTCGADGYLRLGDLVTDASSVVMHAHAEEEMSALAFFNSRMAYSHVMVTANTGLLCSDRGLHHFDIRLPPREQAKKSLLEDYLDRDDEVWRSGLCKACAIWSPGGHYSGGESSYVFAGGSSEIVGLHDLRMDGSRSSVVERYKPHWLDDSRGKVSVSGLDVSKDGKELLVSYESDQIYAFPILHDVKSAGVPTVEEIQQVSVQFETDSSLVRSDLACFGGHLNRFTFLKNARYAGPNDEYVCTGSDSGHSWIYDRRNGTVAALLGADTSTCNGIIPHPSLPFFVSYGIDTTAKVWRATLPVDPQADDSPAGRHACATIHQPYEMSPVTRDWDWVRYQLHEFEDLDPPLMPDAVASREEMVASARFSAPCRRGIYLLDSPRLGNALQSLPMILRQNHFECCRAEEEESDSPVEHPLSGLTKRVSICRLKNQCDRLGLKWQAWVPWAFLKNNLEVHPADMIPDFPSDWIAFDPDMGGAEYAARNMYNLREYGPDLIAGHFAGFFDELISPTPMKESCEAPPQPAVSAESESAKEDDAEEDDGSDIDLDANVQSQKEQRRNDLLLETVRTLKEGGNEALKEGLLRLGARRYDKAIQYCAIAFLLHKQGRADCEALGIQGKFMVIEWSPLLELLIMCRLNMALILLKPEFAQPDRASDQARAAIRLLAPFAVKKGRVIGIHRKDGTHVELQEADDDVYDQAMTLKSKAHFRLGSAELALGDFASAVESFEASLRCTTPEARSKPDSLTTRRLQEARRRLKAKKKRDRAKFQRLLASEEKDSEETTATTT